MRTISATLLAEQLKYAVEPTYKYTLLGAQSREIYQLLVAYTYRETANQMITSELILDNSSGYWITVPPLPGDNVIIERGLMVDGTRYLAQLPTLYVEAVEFSESLVRIECIDFWGLLSRHRQEATYSYSATTAQDIIDDILDAVGLTRSGSVTSLTMNFTITRNERYDHALRRVCAKIPEYPYAGLDEKVKFKALDSSDASDYDYDWNADHTVREMRYILSGWKYNKITVVGSLDATGTEYTGTVESAAQQALTGVRALVLRDPVLVSDAQCVQRATAELAYYEAAATQIELEALPCHGLELYDMIAVAERPGGGNTVKARVKSYIERYGPGLHHQELRLLPPSADIHIEPAEIPDWVIAQDNEASAKIGPAALNAYHTIGAAVRATDAQADYNTAAKCMAEFLLSAGRVAEIGDALLVYNTTGTVWRLYVYESTGPDQWAYVTMTGVV